MSSKLQITALVLVIIAMLLWIGFELLPQAGQQIETKIEEDKVETREQPYVDIVREDARVQALLSDLNSSGGEEYFVRTFYDDGSATIGVMFEDVDGVRHALEFSSAKDGKSIYPMYYLDGATGNLE